MVRSDVIRFIGRFTDNGKRTEVIDAFMNGCCYWFALILERRFTYFYDATIVYDQIDNHFGCEIDGEVYDITGVVTGERQWVSWRSVYKSDANLAEYIRRDCINF